MACYIDNAINDAAPPPCPLLHAQTTTTTTTNGRARTSKRTRITDTTSRISMGVGKHKGGAGTMIPHAVVRRHWHGYRGGGWTQLARLAIATSHLTMWGEGLDVDVGDNNDDNKDDNNKEEEEEQTCPPSRPHSSPSSRLPSTPRCLWRPYSCCHWRRPSILPLLSSSLSLSLLSLTTFPMTTRAFKGMPFGTIVAVGGGIHVGISPDGRRQ
jgi:hypothetical protein